MQRQYGTFGDYIASLGCERCRTKKTKDLVEGGLKKNFNHTSIFWGCNKKLRLMIRKGVYPYEYMAGWEKFEETGLPPKDAFYSSLNMKGISDQDCEHAQQVWNTMKKKTLGCYHDTYLKIDVLLLADVFEEFRNTCLKNYKLDPAHFCTAPRLAWQALLKTAAEYCEHEKRRKDCELCPNEFRLGLLTDIDMLLMVEKGIRGEITQAVKRYARASNKYTKDLYNLEEESIYLQYLGPNNLYGWAMVHNLPTHVFLWKDAEDVTPEKIDKLVKKEKRGYLLELDVEYPKELHENHNELPVLAERMKIGREDKLVPNLKDKKGYVVDIKALDQALKHSSKLKKLNRIIEFQQGRWMKTYIMLNTRLRTAAKNEFKKDFSKLMNNSGFRKTMGNVRNHKDMKLVTSDKKYLTYFMKPNFKDGHPFSKHLFAAEMGETEIKMNKPVYLGQAILDLTKTLMYEFHYDYMRPKYGSKVKLCYMDTDSFVYEIETKDFYRDIAKDVKKRFDTCGYSRDDNRPLPIGENKEVIGLMNELGGKIITEFVVLRAKMYAYRKIDKEVEEKRCKGTKKWVISEGLKFDDYNTCLFDGKTIYREQMLFENKKHEMYTVNKHKIALNRDNDKRIVQADGITTLAREYVALSA